MTKTRPNINNKLSFFKVYEPALFVRSLQSGKRNYFHLASCLMHKSLHSHLHQLFKRKNKTRKTVIVIKIIIIKQKKKLLLSAILLYVSCDIYTCGQTRHKLEHIILCPIIRIVIIIALCVSGSNDTTSSGTSDPSQN